jgi:hypothetical protein
MFLKKLRVSLTRDFITVFKVHVTRNQKPVTHN